MRIVFRADASRTIGTGHVLRCLTLARILRQQGHDILFVSREHQGHLCDLVAGAGFIVARLPAGTNHVPEQAGQPSHSAWLGADWRTDAEETIQALAGRQVDWIVVDHYAIDRRWHEHLRGKVRGIMVIDDLADRLLDCDLLLDQNFSAANLDRYRDKMPATATALLGPAFALLGDEYHLLRARCVPRLGRPTRILVSFGGADHLGLTRRTVEALLEITTSSFAADIVLPRGSADFAHLERLLHDHDHLTLHDRVPSLAPYMLAADLGIGAGGSTHWERMCLGLPTLVITMADNQTEIARDLAAEGLIDWLGDADTVDRDAIRSSVAKVLEDGLRPDWSARCMTLVDGLGARRVAAALTVDAGSTFVARHAELRDEDLLLRWANDPITRANAFSVDPIPRGDHIRWFRARLRNPLECDFQIIETEDGIPVGQVRLDLRTDEWEISYAVAPEFRGRGLGRRILEIALDKSRSGRRMVIGQVKPNNLASRRIFETLGFSVRGAAADRVIYQRQEN
jgi:UDP-2,4-diacetamido-2,4,6-trideoxy-beta-L-altropyranose hydrolase